MTRGRSGPSGSSGVKDAHTTFFPQVDVRREDLVEEIKRRTSQPFASADLSKLSKNSGTGTI